MDRTADVEALEIQLREWDTQIAMLSALAERADLDAQSDLRDRMARVHSKRKELVARLNELRVASEVAWEPLRQQVEKVARELETAIEEARTCLTI